MRELTSDQAAYAEFVQSVVGLDDWDIRYKFVEAGPGDCYAEVHTRPDYHEAVITLYTNDIAESRGLGFGESIERIVLHELCEIVVEWEMEPMPQEARDEELMMRVRDRLADRIRRIVERMWSASA